MRVMTRIATVSLLLVLSTGCHHETVTDGSFVKSLRCGMTRDEVIRLARESGYRSADASWLTRAASGDRDKSKELTLLDFTFRQGRLVAVRQGTYDPRTRRTDYRTIDLCKAR